MERKQKILFIINLLFVVVIAFITLSVWWSDRIASNKEQDIPRIEIRLHDVNIETIESDKHVKYTGNEVTVLENGDAKKYDGVEIKGHGNSTWETDKKPFQLKFKHKIDLFELGNVKKWLLLANRFDVSQLRNDCAFYLGKMLDMEYAVIGDFVELSIDGDYRGLYYIVPKIEISKNSVGLHSSLGVLVEVDNLHNNEEDCYFSDEGVCLTLKDVVNKDNSDLAMKGFVDSFDQLEVAAKNKDYEKVMKLIDVESFAKYYLLSEFTVNPDSYSSSWYMYKDGVDDKIHAGPGWDFDFALGNHNWVWNNTEDFYSPELDMVREADAMGGEFIVDGKIIEKIPDHNISRVMIWLIKMPQFKEEVENIFMETMSGKKEEFLSYIETQSNKIYPAILRDSDRWKQDDYWTEVDYLLDWINRRYEHFEETYGNQ